MSSPGLEAKTGSEGRPGEKPEAVRIRLLGGFRVSVGPRSIEEDAWRLKKAAAIVKVLALAPEHRLHRKQIIDLLWPALDVKAGSNNLRRTLHVARRVLDPRGERTASKYLVSRGRHVALCPEGSLWVDAETFEELARYARRRREPGAYEAALDLYVGELLPGDRYEGWAEVRRQQLRQTYLSLLSGLASAHEELGDYGSAVEALRKVAREEPANEEAHVRLMRLYALSGRKAEALRQYGSLRENLSRALGAEPDTSARALREEIAAGRFLFETAPRRSVRAGRGAGYPAGHGLPIPRTSFVGRERELVGLGRAVASARLLTLTGTGGSGKTRLALKAATELAGNYPDGVRFVELAGLLEPELVPKVVAGGLGFPEQPGRSPAETVADGLGTKRFLLVLDNCEHLLDGAADLVDHLLDSCPRLAVLATSREPLGVEGEVLFTVPPLPVPEELRADLGELVRNASVRLFLERARQRLPRSSLTEGEARAVARVCKKLEGIPLAIELAAGRTGALAMEQLAERLEASVSLSFRGPRTVSLRQRTMRATFDWSYGLLSEEEKALFRRLSVFAGGFTLEAAEAVCPGGVVRESEALELLSRLVDKSLVVAEVTGETAVRYRVLEPVRQYARERLEASEQAGAIAHRHAAFFLALAERAEPELRGPGQVEWLQRLEEDNGNLRAAMAWLLEKHDIEAAVRLAHTLWIFWLIHGHQSEGRRWIEEALAKGVNLSAHARARALYVEASTHYGVGSPERMRRLCGESAALFRQVGDKMGLAYSLGGLAGAAMLQGDPERALAFFEEALPLSRDVGDEWGRSGALAHLGSIHLENGGYGRATRCFEEGLALSREIGNKLVEATALYGLATAAQRQDDHRRASELYAEGLASAAEVGNMAHIAFCLEGLAQAAAAWGEAERAARLFGAAEASLEAAGMALYPFVQDRSVHEQAVNEARSQMDEAAFSAAWADGIAMSPGEAVEYALSGRRAAGHARPVMPREHTVGGRRVALTRREEEVTLLVTRGFTNRQIASELFISEHTVANHVARTLRKLGLRSRAQLSAWMTSHGAPN